MPRKPRVRRAGAIYHVSYQADGDGALYLDAIDRRMQLAFLAHTADHHELEVHSWCLMTNHAHLLFTTPAPDVDRAMHRLNSRYAHWFNAVHGNVGHVLRRRYTAVVVETDAHLHWCYRYIAMNPVEAGICASPDEWRWSSFGWLYGGYTWRYDLPSDERHLLRHWGDGEEARARLRRYVRTGIA
jgi:REP element-mobilizing transposase RayT